MPRIATATQIPFKSLASSEASKPTEPEPANIKLLKTIAKSKFSVYLAQDAETNANYAMKVFPYEKNAISKYYKNEAKFSNLNHENIIGQVATNNLREFSKKGEISQASYILYELAQFGSIFDLFANDSFQTNEKLARTLFKQLIEGLEYLHSNNIAHLDIKPENLLIGSDNNVKICDFDSSYDIEKDTFIRSRGTKDFRAPEIKKEETDNAVAADIYSAAIILFYFFFGIQPYTEDSKVCGYNLWDLLSSNVSKFWEIHQEISSGVKIPSEFKALFESMTKTKPEERATLAEIKSSKWLQGATYSTEQMASIYKRFCNDIISK